MVTDIIGLATTFEINTLQKYGSWSAVHQDFSLISQLPEELSAPLAQFAVIFGLYDGPLYSIIFFIFFGLGEEAVSDYVALGERALAVLERFGLKSTR